MNAESAGLEMASERVRMLFSEIPEVWAVYLFGSRARGEARPDSDWDLAVLGVRAIPVEQLIRWEEELEAALGHRVEVLDLRRADPFLALDVLRGKRLWARDPVAADEFELYILRRAGDLAHWERERRRWALGGGEP